jgi:hypothetical protein
MAPQERQRPLIEFVGALVQRGVRTPVENDQLGIYDAARQDHGFVIPVFVASTLATHRERVAGQQPLRSNSTIGEVLS